MLKKVVKVLLEIITVILLIALVLMFLSFSAKSEIIPNIYAFSATGKTAQAVRGNYKWTSFTDSIEKNDITPSGYIYLSNNTILVTPEEKIIFKNSENERDCYKFYQLQMEYYDENNNKVDVPISENSKVYADLKYLEIIAPKDEGTYIYNFKFSYYNKGEVSYGLKVIVSTEPNYEINELIKYKNTSIVQVNAVNEILELLPYADYKKNIIIRNNNLKELIIAYDNISIERTEMINNVIALFTLIPEAQIITLKFENEEFVFTRFEIEKQVGRSLEDYANDIDLWKNEILFKEKIADENSSKDSIYKAIIVDIVSEYEEEKMNIAIDTKSFATADFIAISEVDSKEILEFVSDFSDIVYDIDYEQYRRLNKDNIFIDLIKISDKEEIIGNEISGDKYSRTNEGRVFICAVRVCKGNDTKIYSYEVWFENNKWNITEL